VSVFGRDVSEFFQVGEAVNSRIVNLAELAPAGIARHFNGGAGHDRLALVGDEHPQAARIGLRDGRERHQQTGCERE
jgi:hypothetical protein